MSDEKEEEQLNYGILGEDASTDLEKLEKYTGEVDWDCLEKHYKSGALLYVDPSLNLVAVGKAFTEDDADSVATWRQRGDIIQPSIPHAVYWEHSKTRFTALVVSPFVLIQPVEESEAP